MEGLTSFGTTTGNVFRKSILLTALLLVILTTSARQMGPPTPSSSSPPNILLLLTDDQRFDQLNHMPNVQQELIDKGVRFRNGFLTDPLCCPSRATILTGTYAHTHRIYSNEESLGGGFANFRDSTTIATVLKARGYNTDLIGKYLNGYGVKDVSYVPSGWTHWFALTKTSYFGFKVSQDGHPVNYPDDVYQTDVLGQQAVDYIHSVPSHQPLFLYWSPHAPHYPATPAPEYKNRFNRMPPLRPPSFNEADVSDKPAYVRDKGKLSPNAIMKADAFRRDQYRSLLSVDDSIGAIIQALTETGRLDNTLIVFMSDNGLLLGEHRYWNYKSMPYEESIRVPFIVRWDAAAWDVPRTDDQHLVANVDLAETWAEAAGTTVPGAEGMSLLPVLTSPGASWRRGLLIEGAKNPLIPTYCGVRELQYVYVQYATGEEELYDLAADPYELENVASDPDQSATLGRLRAEDHVLCDPLPPGFSWTH